MTQVPGISSSSSTRQSRPQHDGTTSNVPESENTPCSEAQKRESRVKKPKLSLTDYATPASSVSAFCRAVLQKLIPPRFFGEGEHGVWNRRLVMNHVDSFIKLRRFESLSLHEVCKGLKVRPTHH